MQRGIARIERERMVTELELRRAAQARTEEEANAALAALDNDAPIGGPPLPRARRTTPRKGPLALAVALLALALVAVLAAGVAIGRFAFTKAPRHAPTKAPAARLKPEPGLKLDRDMDAFAARAAAREDRK